MRILKLSPNNVQNDGYVLPTVIGLMVIMSLVSYAALLQANNSLNLAYKQMYLQMARVASKAAVDYAKEQFDNATCGNYTGTVEQDLVSNSRYRITMKADVISTSADGYEKTVKGTGSVYLPRQSATAKYVFDIRSEIVRTYAVCKTPDNYAPIVWLDASDTDTLKTTSSSTTTITSTTSFGSANNSTRDTLEERADNGSQTTDSWQSNDLEMHFCDSTEFSSSICSSSSRRQLYTGFVFQNMNIPKNATINSASLQITGGTPAGSSGNVTHRIYGLYNSATDPHLPLFSSTGNSQIRSRITNSSLRTSAFNNITTNNFPPGNTTVFNVTSVVQEMVNNANWDSTTGRFGFGIQRQSGSTNGTRRATKNGVQLVINYTSTGAVSPSVNNGTVTQWDDKSGNGNHAQLAYGTAPVRVDNQINGKTIVRFNNGTLLSSLTSMLTNKREMTVLAVVKSNFSTSASDGRVVSGMNTSSNNDTSDGTAILPLLRYNSGNGFSSNYSGGGTSYRTNYSCGGTCANTTYLYGSVFTVDTSNTITANLKGSGAPVANRTSINPGSNYTYSINQLYFGGRRNGAVAGGSGADYFNGDFAELIVYDKALECKQIEALEDYLRIKWNISGTVYTTTCPEDVIPTL